VFEPLLTGYACGGIGNGEKAFPWNGGSTLGADSVLAIRYPRQRDVQTSGPLSQPRRGETRQLLTLDTLREIEEIATRGIGRRHRGLVL
jgi:hypothetical protein